MTLIPSPSLDLVFSFNWKKKSFKIIYRNPAVDGCPIAGFKPAQGDELNFLDITNDGLVLGRNPSGDLMDFVRYFRRESLRLITKHGDLPKKNEFDRLCKEFRYLNRNQNS